MNYFSLESLARHNISKCLKQFVTTMSFCQNIHQKDTGLVRSIAWANAKFAADV